MSNDLLITPASRKLELKDSSGNIDAKIETDGSGNLLITNVGGSITIGDASKNINIPGNLVLTGDLNQANVTDLDVTDKTITLGIGQSAGSSGSSGIKIDGSNASILWNQTNSHFDINNDIDVDGFLITRDNVSSVDDLNSYIMSKTTGSFPTGTNPSADNAVGIISMQTHQGNYFSQLGLDTHSNDLHMRSAHNSTSWTAWKRFVRDGDAFSGAAISGTTITASDTVTSGHDFNAIHANSPTLHLRDTTNGVKLLAYAQNSDARIGTYSNHPISFDTNSAQRMHISNTGFVGIGTASPPTGFRLEVAHGTDTSHIMALSGGHTGRRLKIKSFTNNSLTGAGFIFDADSASGSIKFQTTSTDRLIIDRLGQVGIGTAPGVKFHVSSGTTNRVAKFVSTDGTAYIQIADSGTTATTHGYGANGNDLSLYANDAERIRIKSTGTVGIANTDPYARLQVRDTIFDGTHGVHANDRVNIASHGALQAIQYASTYNSASFPDYGMVFVHGNTTSNYNVWSISPDGPAKGDSLNFIYGSNTSNIHTITPKVVFDGNGHVGIGTTSPPYKLSVHDAGDNVVGSFTSGDNQVWINLNDDGGGTYGALLGHDSDAGHLFTVANNSVTKMFTIDDNGNVMIGNTGASAKLDIRHDSGYAIRAENGSGYYFRVEAGGDIETLGNVQIQNNAGQIQFGASGSMQMFHNSVQGKINNAVGNFEIDTAGDISFDADGGDIRLKDDGVIYGNLNSGSGNFNIKNPTADKDIIFGGNDGGTTITAFKLDMSQAGQATLNSNLYLNGSTSNYLSMHSGDMLRHQTGSGYIEFGPANTGFGHIQTDRDQFYFNKFITVDGGVFNSYNEDAILRRAGSSGNQITIGSTSISATLPFHTTGQGDSIGHAFSAEYYYDVQVGDNDGADNKWTLKDANGNDVASTTANKVYRIRLVTLGTGTDTGAVYIADNVDGAGWRLNAVNIHQTASNEGSNYPFVELDNSVPKVSINHPSNYNVRVLIEEYNTGNGGGHHGIFGADYMLTAQYANKYLGVNRQTPGHTLDVGGGIGINGSGIVNTSRKAAFTHLTLGNSAALGTDGGEDLRVGGVRGTFSTGGEGIHLYRTVAVGHPGGWGQGLTEAGIGGISSYGGCSFAYNNGNVGIGVAHASAAAKLDVRGNIFATSPGSGNSPLLIKYDATYSNNELASIKQDGAESIFRLRNNAAAIEVQFATGTNSFILNEKFGLGTTTPSHKLYVMDQGQNNGELVYLRGGANFGAGIVYSRNDSYTWFAGVGGASSQDSNIPASYWGVEERSASGRPVRLAVAHTTGRVGIGTTAPATTLHVVNSSVNAEVMRITTTGDDPDKSMSFQSDHIHTTNGDLHLGINGRVNRYRGTRHEFQYGASNTEGFRLNSDGRVGIGDTSPDAQLHVVANSDSLPTLLLESTVDSSNAAPVLHFKRHSSSPADADYLGQLKFQGENDADQQIVYAKMTAKIQDASDGSEDGLLEFMNKKAGANVITARLKSDSFQLLNGTTFTIDNDSNDLSKIGDNNGNAIQFEGANLHMQFELDTSEVMRLESNGKLHCDNDVVAFSTTVSDERLKDKVVTIDGALDKVLQLRGVEYTWNNTAKKGKRDLGVIAQEVEKVLPQIVQDTEMPLLDGETYKTVDYEKMTGVLIEAMKEQQTIINRLEEKISDLEKKLIKD